MVILDEFKHNDSQILINFLSAWQPYYSKQALMFSWIYILKRAGFPGTKASFFGYAISQVIGYIPSYSIKFHLNHPEVSEATPLFPGLNNPLQAGRYMSCVIRCHQAYRARHTGPSPTPNIYPVGYIPWVMGRGLANMLQPLPPTLPLNICSRTHCYLCPEHMPAGLYLLDNASNICLLGYKLNICLSGYSLSILAVPLVPQPLGP